MIVDDFQKLIGDNKSSFSDDELGLFNDSVRCFHSGIFRPAYILAYQGMMIYFRRMLQNAKMPSGYDTGMWTGVQTRLAKDSEWEDEVNKAIRKQPDPKKTPPVIALLCMSENLRKDFDFWRNRRNDCAHYKEYNINDSHVLAFYSFLTQYLMKISVEGGMVSLLNEFKDACDPIKTSPNTSLQPLVDKILTKVNPDEMDDFFEQLEAVMGNRLSEQYGDLLAGIIKGSNKDLKEYVVKFARSNIELKTDLIDSHPDLVGHLVKQSEAREYWMKYLKHSRNRVAVLARMLMICLINPSETDEAIRTVLKYSFDNNQMMGDVTEEELTMLKSSNFYKALKEEYFNKDYTSKHARDCGETKYNFFYGFVKFLPINKEWVETLIEIFSQKEYPRVWLNIYEQDFLSDQEYKAKFDKVVVENSISLPKCLENA